MVESTNKSPGTRRTPAPEEGSRHLTQGASGEEPVIHLLDRCRGSHDASMLEIRHLIGTQAKRAENFVGVLA